MSQERKKKLRRREERRILAERKRQEFFAGAIQRAGLESAVRRVPHKLREILESDLLAMPHMRADSSAQGDPHALDIQHLFAQLIHEPSVESESGLCFAELIRVVLAVTLQMEKVVRRGQGLGLNLKIAPWPSIVDLALQAREFLKQHEQNITNEFFYQMWAECVTRSKLDDGIYWFDIQVAPTAGRKRSLEFLLHKHVPDRISISADMGARPAFRCCDFDGPNGIKEISWTSSDMGIAGESREYPLYMQSHALEQLSRRVPFHDSLFLADSLSFPCFAKQSNDHFLVEYRYDKNRLGYFAGVRLGDQVLLKTFLFLTMQGTPESDLLYEKLRLTRRDIEFMELDQLSVFMDADVRGDAALERVFQECGCGHLLTMQAPEFQEAGRRGTAESLRKYLSTWRGWQNLQRSLDAPGHEEPMIKDLGVS
jgi:hypothetical protein